MFHSFVQLKLGSGALDLHHYPPKLRSNLENISALHDLHQEVLHCRSVKVSCAITEQTRERGSSILKSLEVVQHLHRTVGIQLKHGSQRLVSAELRGSEDVSTSVFDQASIRVLAFGLREAMDHSVSAVAGDLVHGPVFRDAALNRRAEQVATFIEQQTTLRNRAISTASKCVQDRERASPGDLEDDTAARSWSQEELRAGEVATGLCDAV